MLSRKAAQTFYLPLELVPQKKAVPISVFVSRKLGKLLYARALRHCLMSRSRSKIRTSPWERTCLPYWNRSPKGHYFAGTWCRCQRNFLALRANLNKKPKAPVQAAGGTVRPDRLPDGASAALDRVEIPRDEVGRISQLLTPSSSLILSDYELSTETGDDTDFIVVMP